MELPAVGATRIGLRSLPNGCLGDTTSFCLLDWTGRLLVNLLSKVIHQRRYQVVRQPLPGPQPQLELRLWFLPERLLPLGRLQIERRIGLWILSLGGRWLVVVGASLTLSDLVLA